MLKKRRIWFQNKISQFLLVFFQNHVCLIVHSIDLSHNNLNINIIKQNKEHNKNMILKIQQVVSKSHSGTKLFKYKLILKC